jgi:hypothetical protein
LAATLNHILLVDRFYVDAMESGRLGAAAWSDPGPAALREAQEHVDQRLIAIVEPSGGLTRVVELYRAAGVQRERMDRVLLDLFQHHASQHGPHRCAAFIEAWASMKNFKPKDPLADGSGGGAAPVRRSGTLAIKSKA